MPHQLTKEQEAIVKAKERLLAITAYAGTGKTTTLKAYAKRHPGERMLYLAFNRAMADEAKIAFLPVRNVEVRTLHSLAFKEFGQAYQNTLGNFRVLDLAPYLSKASLPTHMGLARVLYDLLSDWMISNHKSLDDFLKQRASKTKKETAEYKINPRGLSKAAKLVWKDMLGRSFTMPHNGYFKLFQLSRPDFAAYDAILVDEAQDLNDCMIEAVFGARGKIILVGDPFQQVYGWNGAVDALVKASKVGAKSYYLTQSFRCPVPVADLANQYLKFLGAKRNFLGVSQSQKEKKEAMSPEGPTFVIGRTNAAIFDFAAQNMAKMKLFYNGGFKGYQFDILKDINYLSLMRRDGVKDPFLAKFKSYEELKEYVEQADDVAMRVRMEVEKKYKSTVHAIYSKMMDTQTAFEPASDAVVSTAHKAKGKEYGRVILLNDFVSLQETLGRINKSKNSGTYLEKQAKYMTREEFRLLYVAITRSWGSLQLDQKYLLPPEIISEAHSLIKKGRLVLV
jgi:superfamily I DNA/RNA helicase